MANGNQHGGYVRPTLSNTVSNQQPKPNKADPSTWNRNPTGWTPAQPGSPQYEYVRHSLSDGRQPYQTGRSPPPARLIQQRPIQQRPQPPQKVIRPSPYPAPVNHGMPTNPDWRDRRAYSHISQSPRRYEQNKPGEPRFGLTPVKNALYDNRGRIGGYRFELGIPKKPIKFL